MRLFVAVDLPGGTRDRIEQLLSDLRRDVRDVRWARCEGIHLTLKFLGEAEETRLPAIEGALVRAAAGARGGFQVGVKGTGTFGDRGRPRVVWLGLDDPTGGLARVAAAVEDACGDLGFERERRAFHPHLTLARLKGPSKSLAPALASRASVDLGEIVVTSYFLFRSLLRPSGAEYLRLAEFRLATGSAAP